MRGDDCAGLLEVREQRDRGADGGVLPVVGNGKTAHPFAPIVDVRSPNSRQEVSRLPSNGVSELKTRWSGCVSTSAASRSMYESGASVVTRNAVSLPV